MSVTVKMTCNNCSAEVKQAQEIVDHFIADAQMVRELKAKALILDTVTAERDYLRGIVESFSRATSPLPYVSVPYIAPIECQHMYPSPWLGTVPPNCLKCGNQAPYDGPTFSTGDKP